jgi:hypothetical protein
MEEYLWASRFWTEKVQTQRGNTDRLYLTKNLNMLLEYTVE